MMCTICCQGYLVIGLEERLKYLRTPKTGTVRNRSSEGDQPPPKKALKPVHPTFAPSVFGIGEDDDSNRRNIKMLQSLAKLVCIRMQHCMNLLYMPVQVTYIIALQSFS